MTQNNNAASCFGSMIAFMLRVLQIEIEFFSFFKHKTFYRKETKTQREMVHLLDGRWIFVLELIFFVSTIEKIK